MKKAYVTAYIGQKPEKTTELKDRVSRMLEDESIKVYIAGNSSEWEKFNDSRVHIMDEIVYDDNRPDDLKSVHDSLILFDKAHYTEKEKNIIRKVCILAAMHNNQVIISLPDFNADGSWVNVDSSWERVILKLSDKNQQLEGA